MAGDWGSNSRWQIRRLGICKESASLQATLVIPLVALRANDTTTLKDVGTTTSAGNIQPS